VFNKINTAGVYDSADFFVAPFHNVTCNLSHGQVVTNCRCSKRPSNYSMLLVRSYQSLFVKDDLTFGNGACTSHLTFPQSRR
jgi:hypothetical protein